MNILKMTNSNQRVKSGNPDSGTALEHKKVDASNGSVLCIRNDDHTLSSNSFIVPQTF